MKSNKLSPNRRPLMTATRKASALCVLAMAALLAGCGGSGSSGYAAPAPELQTEFSGFVEDQFASTADDTAPVMIKTLDFNFVNQDDPAAFDALLEQ